MSVFAGYSRYYDLLYGDKDYTGEASWVADMVRRHSPGAKSVMEIGCGTGLHASELAKLGFEVTGVDMSAGMLERAEQRLAGLPVNLAGMLSFWLGDARSVRLGKEFDAVISLFHVMSYQTSNEDLAAAFATASAHLRPGGVFVFDCWYGPAVIRQWPAVTVKELVDDRTHVRRVAEPVIHATTNVVDVNYEVTVTDNATGASEVLRETHHMRYLFSPEIEQALRVAGLKLVESRAWLADGEPDFSTWGACFAAVAESGVTRPA